MAEVERVWRLEFEKDHQNVLFRWAAEDRWRGGAGANLDISAATPETLPTTATKKLRGDRVASLLLILAHQRVYGASPRDLCKHLRGMPGWAPNIEARSVNPALQDWLDAARTRDDGREHTVGPFVYRLDERRRSTLWLRGGVEATLPVLVTAWLDAGVTLREACGRWIADESLRLAQHPTPTSAIEILAEHVGVDQLHWAYAQPPHGAAVVSDALVELAKRGTVYGLVPEVQRARYVAFARRLEELDREPPLGVSEHGAVKRVFFDLEHGGFCLMRFARGGYVCGVVLEESRDGLRLLLQRTQALYETLRPVYAPGDRDVIVRIV